MANGQSSKEAICTRRTRRKADDVVKPLVGSSRKRPKHGVPTTTVTERNSSSIPGTRRKRVDRSGVKKQSSSLKEGMTEKEKEQLNKLLKKAALNEKITSTIKVQLQDRTEKTSNSDNELSDTDSFTRPKKPSSTRVTIKNNSQEPFTTSKRSSLRTLQEDEEQVEEPHEFCADENEVDEDGKADLEHDDDDEPMDMMGKDIDTTAPILGVSDDEQELSFNPTPAAANSADEVTSEPNRDHNAYYSTHPAAAITSSNLNQVEEEEQLREEELPEDLASGVEDQKKMLVKMGCMDESVVLNIVQLLKQAIFSQFKSSFNQVLQEIRTDRHTIKKLRQHVSELTSVVSTTASAIFIKNTSSNPRIKEIQKKLCLLPALFNDHLMLKVIPRVVLGFLVTTITEGSSYISLETKGIEFFSVLYFSKQPNEKKKEKFESEVGRIYSKFRYSLLMSSFLAMQNNSFNIFQKDKMRTGVLDDFSTREEDTATTVPSVSAMLQPFWLKPGYILSDHCIYAANKQEKRGGTDAYDESQPSVDTSQTVGDSESLDMQDSSQSSGKPKVSRSGPLTHDEIATEAASMLYKIITSMLYRSRAASKVQLFHDVTYLFTGWGQHAVPIDQRTLKISWEKPRTSEIDYIDSLPKTKIIPPNDRHSSFGQEVTQIDLDNIAHLQELISDHPELSLVIEHEVSVNGNVSFLRYRMNLIEVSCRLLAAYTTLESAAKGKDALRADKRCFKSIIVLSLGLRRLMNRAIDDLKSHSSVPWLDNFNTKGKRGRPKQSSSISANSADQQVTQYTFEEINGMSLDQLLPPPSKQKELLNQMILNMTEEEFNARMHKVNRPGNTVNNNVGMAVLGNDKARIKANESEGVFGF